MNLSENKAIDRVKKAADKFHFTTDQPPHFYLRTPFEGLVGQKGLFIDSLGGLKDCIVQHTRQQTKLVRLFRNIDLKPYGYALHFTMKHP